MKKDELMQRKLLIRQKGHKWTLNIRDGVATLKCNCGIDVSYDAKLFNRVDMQNDFIEWHYFGFLHIDPPPEPIEPPIQRFKESEDHADIEWKSMTRGLKLKCLTNQLACLIMGVIIGALIVYLSN